MKFTEILLIPFLTFTLVAVSYAADTAEKQPVKTTSDRSKNMSFDDAVVEGINKNPLDSLEHVGKQDSDAGAHLYRKKRDFRPELKTVSEEAGYTQ